VSGQLYFLFTFTGRKINSCCTSHRGLCGAQNRSGQWRKYLAARGNRTVILRTPGHYNDHKNRLLHWSALHCVFSAGQYCLQSKSPSGSFVPTKLADRKRLPNRQNIWPSARRHFCAVSLGLGSVVC